MRICYIIFTCEKYLTTRIKYQMNSFLKYVDKNDIFYLANKMDEENRLFAWDAPDDYKSLPIKYVEFFKKNLINPDDYDWFLLIDDDTFIFKNRVEALLSSYNCNDNIMIGRELDHIKNTIWGHYMSGGAGTILSRSLYKLLTNFIKSKETKDILPHWCADIALSLWIKELSKNNDVKRIDNRDLHCLKHNNNQMLYSALSFHQVRKYSEFIFFTKVLDNEMNSVVTLITDNKYFHKSKQTIKDLRDKHKGNWNGDIVLMCIDLTLSEEFKTKYNVTEVHFPEIDKTELLNKIGSGFTNNDGREINKLNQWEKLHAFDDYFKKWSRVIFMDAGLRVVDSIHYLLELDYKNSFLCPNDAGDGVTKRNPNMLFKTQISYDKPKITEKLLNELGADILESYHFLNCIWVYDTEILNICNKQDLIDVMNNYPLCKNNEMTAMNILLNFKHKLWKEFPEKVLSGEKYLFEWCESNKPGTNWTNYCYLKYPCTISFDI